MNKSYLIDKEEVASVINDFFHVIKELSKEDSRKAINFINAVNVLLQSGIYSRGYDMLPKETFYDGVVVETYRLIWFFFLRVGVIEDDD